jgi:hypothetical protein
MNFDQSRIGFCSVLLATGALLLPLRAGASTEFSGWRDADGDGRIQYRWKNYTGEYRITGCDVELRNLDADDRARYRISIDYYQEHNGNGTEDISGTIGHPSIIDISSCDRVHGVMTTRR